MEALVYVILICMSLSTVTSAISKTTSKTIVDNWSRVKVHREDNGDLILTASVKIPANAIGGWAGLGVYGPVDCTDVQRRNPSARSGLYRIYPTKGTGYKVYCDLTTDGGGWTVFQRRQDGTVDFYRNWQDYKRGFGNLLGEHWLGNEILHDITSHGDYELRIELTDWNGNKKYAKYGKFNIGSEVDGYRLTVGSYHGNAGDGMHYHNGMKFSTNDKDNDTKGSSNCAAYNFGAWWFGGCFVSHLNGQYVKGFKPPKEWAGLNWSKWKGKGYSLKETKMMIKRV